MPIEDKSIPFKLFLTFGILFASFRLENWTMTFFDPLIGNQWQSSILYFDIQFFEKPESCVLQFWIFDSLGEAT